MFGLSQLWSKTHVGERLAGRRGARRKSDSDKGGAEATVLRALQVMARRSSPHKAAARASLSRAISVIEASTLGLCHINELVAECQSLCASGLETDSAEKRALLAQRYEGAIEELNAVAQGSGYAGYHLIDDTETMLEVELGEADRFKLRLPHINLTAGPRGLALPEPSLAFENTAALKHFERHLALVHERLTKTSEIFDNHAADLAKRLAILLEGAYVDKDELSRGRTAPAPLSTQMMRPY